MCDHSSKEVSFTSDTFQSGNAPHERAFLNNFFRGPSRKSVPMAIDDCPLIVSLILTNSLIGPSFSFHPAGSLRASLVPTYIAQFPWPSPSNEIGNLSDEQKSQTISPRPFCCMVKVELIHIKYPSGGLIGPHVGDGILNNKASFPLRQLNNSSIQLSLGGIERGITETFVSILAWPIGMPHRVLKSPPMWVGKGDWPCLNIKHASLASSSRSR